MYFACLQRSTKPIRHPKLCSLCLFFFMKTWKIFFTTTKRACMCACVCAMCMRMHVRVCKCVSMKSQKQRDKRRNEDNLPFRWQHLTYNVLARTQTKTIIDIVHCCVWTSHIPCKQYRGESIETSPAMQQDDDTMNKRKSLAKVSKYGF